MTMKQWFWAMGKICFISVHTFCTSNMIFATQQLYDKKNPTV